MKFYFDSNDTDAPVLNTWGSMKNLLKKVLVEGYNNKTSIGITKIDDKRFSLAFSAPHGFRKYQYLQISQSAFPTYNNIFKVIAVDVNTSPENNKSVYNVTLYNSLVSLADVQDDNTESIAVKVASLQFGLEYENADKAIFSTNPDFANNNSPQPLSGEQLVNPITNKFYLSVIDVKPSSFTYTGSAWANVNGGTTYDSVNNVVSGEIFYAEPANLNNHGSRWVYNGTYGSYHFAGYLNYNGTPPNRKWFVVGNSNGFFIGISSNNAYAIYFFNAFKSFKINDQYNLIMNSSKYSSITATSTTSSIAIFPLNGGNSNTNILKDHQGFNMENCGYAAIYATSYIGSGSFNNPSTGGTLYFDTFIYGSASGYRGIYPFLKQPSANNGTSTHKLIELLDDRIITSKYWYDESSSDVTIALSIYDNNEYIAG